MRGKARCVAARKIFESRFGKNSLGFKRAMPYGTIVTVAAIVLAGAYVCVTEASFWSKGLVTVLLLVSLGWRYGFFVQTGLGVFLAFYFAYYKARWKEKG